ncbi:MAG: 3-isopropylmalate dehydratase [Caldilineaceae bacterium]
MTLIHGRAWKYGDNINTDVLFPGKYTYTLREPGEIAKHALEDLDSTFVANVQPGDVIVGGSNFGCGSSREQAASCLVYNGVGAVIAKSFGRIFYRNAVNFGLLAIVCPPVVELVNKGDEISIDLETTRIRCRGGEFTFPPLSASVLGILQAGGLVPYIQNQLRQGA